MGKMCIHELCLDHEVKWDERFGKERLEQNPIFSKGTWWLTRCCGKAMARYKRIKVKRCLECGREERKNATYPEIVDVALCLCCGRKTDPNIYPSIFTNFFMDFLSTPSGWF